MRDDKDKYKGASVKETTGNLSGTKESEARAKAIAEENRRAKMEAARERAKRVTARHSDNAKRRERRTEDVKSKQEGETYRHLTDMGFQNFSMTNAQSCGKRGNGPIKTVIRKVAGKMKK